MFSIPTPVCWTPRLAYRVLAMGRRELSLAQLGRDVKVSVGEYLPALAVPDVSGDSGRFVGGERLSVDDFVYFY